jgi:outer membrane protein assembly factor BamB
MIRDFVLLTLLLSAAAGGANAGSGQIVMYNGGPQHTGVYDTKPLRELSGVRWKYPVNKGVTSPPLVHEGVVYFGDWEDAFYAVEVETGETTWKRVGVGSVAGPPVICDGVAYWGGKAGILFALDAKTGRELWSYKTGGQLCYPPLLQDGLAYFPSHDKHLYVMDIRTGKLDNRITAETGSCSSPSVFGDLILIADWNGKIHAYEKRLKKERSGVFETRDRGGCAVFRQR